MVKEYDELRLKLPEDLLGSYLRNDRICNNTYSLITTKTLLRWGTNRSKHITVRNHANNSIDYTEPAINKTYREAYLRLS